MLSSRKTTDKIPGLRSIDQPTLTTHGHWFRTTVQFQSPGSQFGSPFEVRLLNRLLVTQLSCPTWLSGNWLTKKWGG